MLKYLKFFKSKGFIWSLIAIIAMVIASYISQKIWGNDNPIEQATEKLIEEKTGLDIDLSPES